VAAAVALLLGAARVSAGPGGQTPPAHLDQEVPTFGTTTELVYVRFHIEKKGDYVGAVTKEQLRVLEDGLPQRIELLETPSTRRRTIPPEVTLALDVSSSVMDARLLDERLVKDVIFASLGEQARVALCAFGGELRCLTPPTRDADAVLAGFREALGFGLETRHSGTRLYASIADIVRDTRPGEKVQRAVVVFSDGLDNRGGDVKEAIRIALEDDVRVYAVTLSQAFQATGRTGFGGPPDRTMFDYKKLDLARLARETGGRGYEPGTLDEKSLASILRQIATEITMENVVGYQPEGPATGRKRKVRVELADKSLGKISGGERTLVR
jgi:VWFA-related protein